ncbi:vWA domain-containing protein [Prauserella halophila]|uniref:vWA domain-containing protein n=1 Tax=Prauserella halophila TaxID=185641 RepID=UPI0020A255DC|nr:VWA domain-containing protein [Prauserella halophila]
MVAERIDDAPTALVGFARALAAAGVSVCSTRTATFLTAAAALRYDEPGAIYWAGRLSLASSPDDLAIYDAVFATYFSLDPEHDQSTVRRQAPVLQASVPLTEDSESREEPKEDSYALPPVVRARASAEEVLRNRDLASLSRAEKQEMARLLELLRPGLPERKSRRRRSHATGRIDPRRTVRAMFAAGGELAVPRRHRRRTRPRRIVLLIDVSGSMAPYADALLRFAHVVARYRPNASEVFTIGTRLTRITRSITMRDPDAALRAAADTIPDYSGGTRLGEVLHAFVDRWGHRGTARGNVVVIFSDGWERGAADELAEQVARLGRLARAVVWVNPHKGATDYAPVQSGIVAVLPHIDHFVAGHSLAALEELLDVIRHA